MTTPTRINPYRDLAYLDTDLDALNTLLSITNLKEIVIEASRTESLLSEASMNELLQHIYSPVIQYEVVTKISFKEAHLLMWLRSKLNTNDVNSARSYLKDLIDEQLLSFFPDFSRSKNVRGPNPIPAHAKLWDHLMQDKKLHSGIRRKINKWIERRTSRIRPSDSEWFGECLRTSSFYGKEDIFRKRYQEIRSSL